LAVTTRVISFNQTIGDVSEILIFLGWDGGSGTFYFDLENLVIWARAEINGSARRDGAKV